MKRISLIAVAFAACVLSSLCTLTAPANAADASNCRLVNGVPYEPKGAKVTNVSQAGPGAIADFKNEVITFSNGESCQWSGNTIVGVTTWKLDNPVAVQLAAPKSGNVKKLIDGLEFYALIICVGVIFLSAMLWVVGYKTQNPGQELSAKRGLITALITAMLVGAIPSLMDFTTKNASKFDSAGVISANYDNNVAVVNGTQAANQRTDCSSLGSQGDPAC